MSLLEPIFEAIAQLFEFFRAKQVLKNTSEMQSNADAAQIAKDKDKGISDVNNPNLDNLRKDVAE